jgi:protoporphyrinogen oxidase
MKIWKIGVVGGGPGGLMTAYSLQKMLDRPINVSIFEASDRVGGKILTPQFSTAAVAYEAGAAEFYDYSQFDQDPLKELIAELGLPISQMGGSAVIMDNQVLANLDDIRRQLGDSAHQALVDFDRATKDMMVRQEFYHSDDPEGMAFFRQSEVEENAALGEVEAPAETTGADRFRRAPQPPGGRSSTRFDSLISAVADPDARRYIETLIRSDLATEPSQTSHGYGLQNYLMNHPDYMRLYGIEGGNERLPQELAARVDANFLMQHTVQSISKLDDGQLRVSSIHEQQSVDHDFDFVVIALPHNQIQCVKYDGELLGDAIQQHFDYYHYPAHYLRITILFERAFWRPELTDSYWMLDRFGGCCLYDESSREPGSSHGVLGWLLGGEIARQMSDLSDEELIQEALDSLPPMLSAGRTCAIEGKIHRWVNSVNAMPGGVAAKPVDQRHQPEPLEHPHLFFVGDYLYDSTLNGVIDSADYVARWIAAIASESSSSRL